MAQHINPIFCCNCTLFHTVWRHYKLLFSPSSKLRYRDSQRGAERPNHCDLVLHEGAYSFCTLNQYHRFCTKQIQKPL